MTRIKMHIFKVKLPFYPSCEVKCGLQNRVSTVCVDFTDLNKACPKDPFPMSKIDQLIDVTVGHPRMSFLVAFQGYRQISLALDDQEKTVFCYTYRELPLQSNAIRFEECRIHKSGNDD